MSASKTSGKTSGSTTSEQQTTAHGVYLDVFGNGVLLAGDSGMGKSELALGLISRGHRLIADDAITLSLAEDGKILGICPPVLQDFLEVRGLGILNIRAMYGDTAIKQKKSLKLIVRLVTLSNEELIELDRLSGSHKQQTILGVEIPEVSIPVAPGRNLAILVECAVRNHVLKMTGYHAADEFTARQKQFLERDA